MLFKTKEAVIVVGAEHTSQECTVPVAFSEARFDLKSACFWRHGRYQE